MWTYKAACISNKLRGEKDSNLLYYNNVVSTIT